MNYWTNLIFFLIYIYIYIEIYLSKGFILFIKLMLLNKNIKILIIILLLLITILSIFIYNDYSFTNLYYNIFTTIHCDPSGYNFYYKTNTIYADSISKFKDDLICIQSFQQKLATPVNGYEITDLKTFKEMFFQGYGQLCIFSPDQIIKVNGLIVNNKELYTVDPHLVNYFFELFGIDDLR